ncbi:MAG: outer membrane protein transport protein [Nitrospirae bacterium]|nr:outer membrane protein transport protein [Nitrospirota bacterium]
MRKIVLSVVAALAVTLSAMPAFATNGTNIIGVGTVSRSMGGVGVAAPQDAISAVFANPAAMCYIPCQTSEVDFAGTVFNPTVKAEVSTMVTGTLSAKSQGQPYAFPAIGIYTPINDKWRFAIAAYGVSGLGVDYKDTDLSRLSPTFDAAFDPLNAIKDLPGVDIRTQLAIMKFAPNVAYKINDRISVGAALQINWAQLDLGDGDSHDFGFGTQIGVNFKPVDRLSLGLTYQTPQKHTFKRIYNFNDPSMALFGLATTDNNRDTLALEQPQQVVLGTAYDIIPNKLMAEVNGKWLNWSGADGYGDFDWEDQWIVAIGAQYKPVDTVSVRIGYNYGNNPVKNHDGWNPFATVNLQGTPVNNFFYEYFRNVGFPAIVENHITAGIGINITPKVSLNAGYMHAFENEITSVSAANPFGPGTPPITFKNTLVEDSYEFGLNIMF